MMPSMDGWWDRWQDGLRGSFTTSFIVCDKIQGKLVTRGERSTKLGDSWFIVISIEVKCSIMFLFMIYFVPSPLNNFDFSKVLPWITYTFFPFPNGEQFSFQPFFMFLKAYMYFPLFPQESGDNEYHVSEVHNHSFLSYQSCKPTLNRLNDYMIWAYPTSTLWTWWMA
jgi:hypothetical protein